jgi:predicted kinase
LGILRQVSALLLVVTGPPASGKSGLARDLARALNVPFLSKDEIKERMFEVFGAGDEVGSAVDEAGLSVLFSVAGSNLAAGVSVLVESNFTAESDDAPLRSLVEEHRAEIVQIHCGGEVDELVRSFAERAASGERHAGHDDDPGDAEEVRRKLEQGFWEPLDLPGRLVRIDRDSGTLDVEALATRILDGSG